MKGEANRWLMLFVGIILLGVALRVVPVRPFYGPAQTSAPLPDVTGSESLAVSSLVADLKFIAERPLFNITRSPPEAPPAAVVQQVQEPVVRAPKPLLTGTMKTRDGEMVAYIRFGDEVDSVKLRAGDYRDPWEVESIGDGVARLSYGEQVADLKLSQDQ